MSDVVSKRWLKSFPVIVACCSLAVALVLSGCGGRETGGGEAVAMVIEKTAVSELADGAGPCVKAGLEGVVRDGGTYSVVLVSSKPEVIASGKVKANQNTADVALAGRWEKDDAFAVPRNIDDSIPGYPEADPLEALRVAAETLNTDEAKACGTRTIYYAGSVLPTCGLLDLTGNGKYGDVLEWDYEELIKAIIESTSSDVTEAEALPDLTGIRVVFMGMGRLNAGSQCDVPPERIAQLKSLWTKVVLACGAEFDPEKDFVGCETVTGDDADRSAYPPVTPIVFSETLATSTVTFDANVLEFNGGEPSYKEGQDYGDGVLAPYAESLETSGQQVVILGTTANDGDETGCRDLGRERAEKVKADLVRLGVDESQITVCSAGYEGVGVKVGGEVRDFYHDNWPDGSWDEGVARTNRAIHIIPRSMADDVIARFGV